ncbi:MAG: 3-deoxy-D-manno-octulosonic acid transferase [Chlorobi bacterium]|nr:3-deoxy-D-manno-octulosonic acid transferase [Chlorobiota bacterium]
MRLFYNIFIVAYRLSIGLASFFDDKAALWVKGRRNIFAEIKSRLEPGGKTIWFHCASLGEFEQGRPLIERMKKQEPGTKIFLTFFSPSGYEIRKDYPFADYIFYLPYDSPKNARKFIELVRPQMAIFVKYEFWFNYISELKKRDIPLYLVSGVFREEHYFFKRWAWWQRKQLAKFNYFFLQDEKSKALLNTVGIHKALVAGDTRFDRVREILSETVDLPLIEKFMDNKKVLCAGSSWPPDEDIILNFLDKAKPDIKLIIAPHDISKKHIDDILKKFEDYQTVLYSDKGIGDDEYKNSKVLIINSIGLLNKLYRFADIAYVGGGFGLAIHNLLEAAVYGIPVVYGPKHRHFREAVELAENRGGFPIAGEEDFLAIMDKLISDKAFYKKNALAAGNYIRENAGASEMILKELL